MEPIVEWSEGPVLVRREGRVAIVVLNDPPQNPVARETVEALEELLPALAGDDGVRAVVLSGAGTNFCAGANIKQFGDVGVVETPEGYMRRRVTLMAAIEELPKPVVAAIRGNCLGGGLELAMAAHVRVAGQSSRFGVPEIRLGTLPSWSGTTRLPRLIGREQALRMLLSGAFVDSAEAFRIGLVGEVVEDNEVLTRAVALAEGFAAQPRLAVAGILDAVVRGLDRPFGHALELELAAALVCRETKDFREGSLAFREKRPPQFD